MTRGKPGSRTAELRQKCEEQYDKYDSLFSV